MLTIVFLMRPVETPFRCSIRVSDVSAVEMVTNVVVVSGCYGRTELLVVALLKRKFNMTFIE